jgi:hypothetical protein
MKEGVVVQAGEQHGVTTSALEEYLRACVNVKAAREVLAKAELARDRAAAQFMRALDWALRAATSGSGQYGVGPGGTWSSKCPPIVDLPVTFTYRTTFAT